MRTLGGDVSGIGRLATVEGLEDATITLVRMVVLAGRL
jgi:hypothetical protein